MFPYLQTHLSLNRIKQYFLHIICPNSAGAKVTSNHTSVAVWKVSSLPATADRKPTMFTIWWQKRHVIFLTNLTRFATNVANTNEVSSFLSHFSRSHLTLTALLLITRVVFFAAHAFMYVYHFSHTSYLHVHISKCRYCNQNIKQTW